MTDIAPSEGWVIGDKLFSFCSIQIHKESQRESDSLSLVTRNVTVTICVTIGAVLVIVSFADKRTAAIFAGYQPRKGISSRLANEALAKMQQLHAAAALVDLRVPPGNRLEALKGDRRGQFSIRVDRQWRLCFRWDDNHAYDVELVDYHD